MDAKNDDSAGSDSLDKTLQRKCVVDDVGQGEGVDEKAGTTGEPEVDVFASIRPKKMKTDEQIETMDVAEVESAVKVPVVKAAPAASDEKEKTHVQDLLGGPSTSAAAKIRAAAIEAAEQATAEISKKCLTVSIAAELAKGAAALATTSANAAVDAQCSAKNARDALVAASNNAFESKVIQIAKDLKETSLTDDAASCSKTNKKIAPPDGFASTNSSSSSSISSDAADPVASTANISHRRSHSAMLDTQGSSTSSHDQGEDSDGMRSKKVRFHPDAKENDGGNPVIPKKKKKLKPDHFPVRGQDTDGNALVDDNEDEPDEFDLAQTIAEAQDYLKAHPLTFVRSRDRSAGRLQNGLLEEEDLKHLSESSDSEDDFWNDLPPENGVERILGKQVKGGRTEFLLRYSLNPGLHWEDESVIWNLCPKMLAKYKAERDHRRQMLQIKHVSKRLNLRQRYTDF